MSEIAHAGVLLKMFGIEAKIEDRTNAIKWVPGDPVNGAKAVPKFPRPIHLFLGKPRRVTRPRRDAFGICGSRDYTKYDKVMTFKDGESLLAAVHRIIAERNPVG